MLSKKQNQSDIKNYFVDNSGEVVSQPGFDIESSESSNEQDKQNYFQKPDRTEELAKAFEKNSDTVGWIFIPGTTIDWPIMKGVNNDYYLRKNEEKEYAFEGCIFGDFYSKFFPFNELSNNLVVHGHNLDDNPNGKRFSQLVKFQNIEFARKTPYIFITTRDASLVYEIYAVFFTEIKFGYTKVGLNENFQQIMIDDAKRRSEYIYDAEVSGNDKIVTLSTCTYLYGPYGSAGQKNTRFVVQGKLLSESETKNLKTEINLSKNPHPKKPNLNSEI